MTATPGAQDGRAGRLLLALGLLAIALNLRPVFSSLAPVLPEVMGVLQVSPTWASVLTTGPVLCLGLFAPLTPSVVLRWGAERVALAALTALAIGTALRGVANFPVVLGGSLLAGAGVAALNVLMPAFVKRDFADRAALMTGSYSMALCAGAAMAAGATAPLSQVLGSAQLALAAWCLAAILAILLWLPQWPRREARDRPVGESISGRGLRRKWLAWQLTLFMGLQSALAYCVFGWLAPILRERGMDPTAAGLAVAASILAQVASSFLAPHLAARLPDQRGVAVALVTLAAAGFLGALYGPLWSVWGWALLQGLGQGGLFSVTMTLIVLRSPDARTAAALSGMAQGGGYVLASLGPLLLGIVRDATGDFAATGWLVAAIGAGAIWAGWGAGRKEVLPSVIIRQGA